MDLSTEKSVLSEELKKALENLELLASRIEEGTIPSLYGIDVKAGKIVAEPTSPVQKTFFLTRKLLRSWFQPRHHRPPEGLQQEIKGWISTVKAHYNTIEQLRHSNTEEAHLAQSAIATINRYNRILARLNQRPSSIASRLERLLYRQAGFSLDGIKQDYIIPPIVESRTISGIVEEKKITPNNSSANKKRIASIFQPAQNRLEIPSEPLRQEVDAFHLKVVRLLQKQQENFPPREIAQELKRSPINLSFQPCNESQPHAEQKVTLSQSVELFPGEIHKVFGSFKRLSKTSDITIPIPDSFHLITDSQQSAFPRPSQHTGWALSDRWIPQCPDKLSDRPKIAEIYQKKWAAAKELLPGGTLLPRAKRLLRLKKEAFNQNTKTFLDLHQEMCLALAYENREGEEKIGPFFNFLEKHHDPFSALSETYSTLNHTFAHQTFGTEKSLPLNISLSPTVNAFLQFMGKIQREVALSMWLKQVGISRNEEGVSLRARFQTCAFQQLMAFLEDIEKPDDTPEKVERRLYDLVETDIALLTEDLEQQPAFALVQELQS